MHSLIIPSLTIVRGWHRLNYTWSEAEFLLFDDGFRRECALCVLISKETSEYSPLARARNLNSVKTKIDLILFDLKREIWSYIRKTIDIWKNVEKLIENVAHRGNREKTKKNWWNPGEIQSSEEVRMYGFFEKTRRSWEKYENYRKIREIQRKQKLGEIPQRAPELLSFPKQCIKIQWLKLPNVNSREETEPRQ